MTQTIKGEYAWFGMGLSILVYDLIAIKTKKAETMSSALWRCLEHPLKSPALLITWLITTHHLFANKKARAAFKNLAYTFMNELETRR